MKSERSAPIMTPVSLERAIQILSLEVKLNTATGKIKSVTIKDNRLSIYLVGRAGASDWFSAFLNNATQDFQDMARKLQPGDEVELTYTTAESKKQPGKYYNNITSIIPVIQVKEEGNSFVPEFPNGKAPADVAESTTNVAKYTTTSNQSDGGDTRIRSMAVAYAKDVLVASPIDEDGFRRMTEEQMFELARKIETYIING